MTNNRAKIKRDGAFETVDAERIRKAQNRLFIKYRKLGNWRAVGRALDLPNHKYAYDLYWKAIVPSNPDIRVKLFLPRVMPSERPAKRVREVMPKIWENPFAYFKKPKVQKLKGAKVMR